MTKEEERKIERTSSIDKNKSYNLLAYIFTSTTTTKANLESSKEKQGKKKRKKTRRRKRANRLTLAKGLSILRERTIYRPHPPSRCSSSQDSLSFSFHSSTKNERSPPFHLHQFLPPRRVPLLCSTHSSFEIVGFANPRRLSLLRLFVLTLFANLLCVESVRYTNSTCAFLSFFIIVPVCPASIEIPPIAIVPKSVRSLLSSTILTKHRKPPNIPPQRKKKEKNIMEGYLLLPPERGIIIGRAVWKVIYSSMMFCAARTCCVLNCADVVFYLRSLDLLSLDLPCDNPPRTTVFLDQCHPVDCKLHGKD